MSNLCPKDCRWRNAYCHTDCPKHTHYRGKNEQNKEERHKETAVKVYLIEQKNKAIEIKRQHKRWRKETK